MQTRPASVLASIGLILLPGLTSVSLAQSPRPQPRLLHVLPAGGRAGSAVEITVGGEALDAAEGLWFSHPGIRADHVAGKAKMFKVTIKPGTPLGPHDIRALTPDGLSNPRTFVVGVLPEAVEAEPNSTPDAANPIGLNQVVNGTIGPTDVDCFAVAGKEGQRLLINLAAERIDSPLDATVRLLDARGAELVESRDAFGADPFLDATLPADGRYVVKVHDVTYAGSVDHVYRLTVRDGPSLDAAIPPIAAAGPAKLTLLGRHIGGTPWPRKIDRQPAEEKPWSGTPTFVPAPGLPINLLGTAAAVRAFPIRVGPEDNPSNPILVAEAGAPVVAEREPNDLRSPQAIVLPCSVGGSFDRRYDLDVYRFAAKKGEAWRIEAVAEGIGSPADPAFVVQRVPASDEPEDLASADDTPDPGLAPRFNLATVDAGLRWTAPADGTYQVLLSDVASSVRGDPRLAYRLTLRRDRPDFRLFVVPTAINALDATTVRRGGRAAAVVLAWRLDGFSGPILVRPEGLPKGLRCDPMVIPAGASSAPIVVEADTSAEPSVGVVRLVGVGSAVESSAGPKGRDLGSWLGSVLVHEAIPGSILRPPPSIPGTVVRVTPARATRGFAVGVRDESPFLLTARPRRKVVAQGHPIDLDVTVRPGPGFDDAIAVGAWEPPAGLPAPAATIARGTTSARVAWAVPEGLASGAYTLALKGSATYQPDPKGAAKFKVDEPSNAFVVTVRPAPIAVFIASKPVTVKAGETAEFAVKVERRGSFTGPVTIALDTSSDSRLRAQPTTLAPDQVVARLVVSTSKEGPVRVDLGAVIRAESVVAGEAIEISVPLPLTLAKP